MGVNDLSLVNGVTKEETVTGFIFSFPLVEITTSTSGELITIFTRNNPSSTRTVAFEDITNQLGASDAETYADALAVGGFYFNAAFGRPTLQSATEEGNETDQGVILKTNGLTLKDTAGNVKGALGVTASGLTLLAIDQDSNLDNLTVGGDLVLFGDNALGFAFQGAVGNSVLTLLNPVNIGGTDFYPLSSQELPPPTTEETLTDANDHVLNAGTVIDILTDTLTNQFDSGSNFEIRMSAVELTANRSTEIEIIVNIAGVDSTPATRTLIGGLSNQIVISGVLPSAIIASSAIILKVQALNTGQGRDTRVLGSTTTSTTIRFFTGSIAQLNEIVHGISTIVLEASSFINQEPSGTDTPLQISFGAAQSNATVSLAADGTITFLQDGLYNIVLDAEYGRTGASGESELRFRALVNDNPQNPVVSARIDSPNTRIPLFFTLLTNFDANDTFKLQILRDSSGNDSGGLFTAPSTPGDWADSPSARISIDIIT